MQTKQVIVIRKDLKMRKGKMCSQSTHASMKVILDKMDKKIMHDPNIAPDYIEYSFNVVQGTPWYEWLTGSFTKIVVYVNSEQELLDLYDQAKSKELPCSLIQDRGFTEFHGVPTYTAVAIGPWWSEVIDEITGDLPLL